MSSSNGKLPEEYRVVVLEELARGGFAAVSQRFSAMTDVPVTLRPRALAYANKVTGGLFDRDDLAEIVRDGKDAHRLAVEVAVRRKRADRDARVLLASEAVETPTFPTGTLADDLKLPDPEQTFAVDDLLPMGGNALIVGPRKGGKTTIGQGLVKALADDEPFLGVFQTHLTGRVGIWNYELPEWQQRQWLRDANIVNQDRVAAPLNLRGQRLPFWLPSVRDPLVEYLRANEIQVQIIDPGARAWRGLVEDENSNSQMAAFTAAVDELKRLSGVSEVIINVHTGRAIVSDGQEHSRGATSLEDWADALWYLTKDKSGQRFLSAIGRDVELEATALQYDPSDRSLHFTGTTRREHRREDSVLAVLVALSDCKAADIYPTPTAKLQEAMTLAQKDKNPAVRAAMHGGYITREDGPHNSKLVSFTKKGRRRVETGDDS